MRRVSGTKVTRLTLGSLPFCPLFRERVLPALRGVGMGRQMTAEAVVVAEHRRDEGPNMIRGEEPVLRDDRRHRQRG